MEIFQLCIDRHTPSELDLFTAIAKKVWLRRNAMLFEGTFDHPNKVYVDVVASVEDFRHYTKANYQTSIPVQHEGSSGGSGWTTPPLGKSK
jgi:hypothetical protein